MLLVDFRLSFFQIAFLETMILKPISYFKKGFLKHNKKFCSNPLFFGSYALSNLIGQSFKASISNQIRVTK